MGWWKKGDKGVDKVKRAKVHGPLLSGVQRAFARSYIVGRRAAIAAAVRAGEGIEQHERVAWQQLRSCMDWCSGESTARVPHACGVARVRGAYTLYFKIILAQCGSYWKSRERRDPRVRSVERRRDQLVVGVPAG